MNQQELQTRVIEIVADNLELNASELSLESHLMEDLGADSLDAVEIIMAVEEKFDIEIPDEDAEVLSTIKQISDYVENKLN